MLSLLCIFFYALLNFLIPPSCLPISISFPKYHSSTVSAVFLSISAVLYQSSGNPSSPPKILVISCLNLSWQLVSFSLYHRIFGFTFSAFSFSPWDPFFIPPYGAALRHTYSILPYNRTFSSGPSFCTLHNLLGYFFCDFYTSPCVRLSFWNKFWEPPNPYSIHNHWFFLISCSSNVPPHYFLIPYVFFAHMFI